MIEDCKKGKVDRVITKSISRFARNARDCKDYVMQLKELGISVYFEKERLDTMQAGTDLVLSILSSIAEQESRDTSTNLKWTWRKKFEKGEVMLNTARFLGYDKDEKKNIIIVPEEAEVVRRIYREFIGGKTNGEIARALESDGIKSPGGFDHWHPSTVYSILTNEKYKGDAILQKTFSVDFLSKRMKNIGQVERFDVTNSHPAIISRELAELADAELNRRRNLRSSTESGHGKYSSKYPFSGILVCGQCNSKFRRHAQWSGDTKTPIWVCINKQVSKNKDCQALPIKESVLEQSFVECLHRLIDNRVEFVETLLNNINDCLADSETVTTATIDAEIVKAQTALLELNRSQRNGTIDKPTYLAQYDTAAKELESLMEKRDVEKCRKEEIWAEGKRMEEMKEFLDTTEPLNCFNPDLLVNLVERIKVMDKHNLLFIFKCGLEYEMQI